MSHVIKVYRYGLLPPTTNALAVSDQMRLAHRYRNTLTEIERGRRASIRALASSDVSTSELERAVAEADAEAERLARAIKAARAEARGRVDTAADREALKSARAAKKNAVRALVARRKATRADREAATVAVEDRAAELRRSARAYSGLGEMGPHKGAWGTYLLAEYDADKARKDTPIYDGAEACDPRYLRWSGDGRVGVQIQGGVSTIGVLAGRDTQIKLEMLPARGDSKRAQKRHYGTLAMRIGSEGRAPVWAIWPIVMHRPLPADGVVKNAVVHRRMIGPREEWYVTITVTQEERAPRVIAPAGSAIAIDVGWRLIAGDGGARELRVAYWVGTNGESGELRLSEREIAGLTKADSLRSIRDGAFNAARDALAKWLAATPAIPSWLADATKTLVDWRSPARLAAIAGRWRAARFTGDDTAYGALETWRYQDRHLWRWECDQREGAQRHRRERYRIFARWLADHYETVVLEAFDLRGTQRRAATGSDADKRENATARLDQKLAAVSELRGCIANAMPGRIHKVDGAYSTRACHVCGVVKAWDSAATVHHGCECGAVWDQDENAARNLLMRWRERPSDDENAATARKEKNPSRGERMRAARAAKDAAKATTEGGESGAARKADDKAAE